MGTLQDKVNERIPLTEEETAKQRSFKEREVALQNQMTDAMVAINTLHDRLVAEVKTWWRDTIKSKNLNVEELVYGIEFTADGEKATLVVADFVKKPTPQDMPSAVRKHIKAVPDLPEVEIGEVSAIEAAIAAGKAPTP
jgi:hypothetical protein